MASSENPSPGSSGATPAEEAPSPLQVMGLQDADFTEARIAEGLAEDERADHVRAPSVVAVVVTHDAGDWFDEVLEGLRDQDYPNLSVLVLDAGEVRPAAERVEAVLPMAFVAPVEGNPGFGPAANRASELVLGASFLVFCHDDVHLAPDVVRTLVDEALRSDAGVVGPKLVAWDDPRSLLQVGESADKTGVIAPLVERGELDQEQHDAVRDVFSLPGGCTLVRAELFEALGGFDPAITFLGEDLDLCWRAQVAGARVVVTPGAVVRHREALVERGSVGGHRRLLNRHRLRTMLSCYGLLHLLRVLPWAIGLSLGEVVLALATGHVHQAGDVVRAWTWNLRRLPDLRRRRRLVRSTRALPDREVRQLQVRGSARLRAYVRGELRGGTEALSIAGLGRELTGPSGRTALAVWAGLLLVLVVGSRGLLGDALPSMGSLTPFVGPMDALRAWASGYRDAALGGVGPSPTAFGLIGLGGLAMFGQMGALQQLLVLGMVPLGLVGTWRLAGPLASRWGRIAALVVYASVPLPYDALAEGSWGALALYGAAPWVLRQLLRATGEAPFASARVRPVRRAVVLGLVVALVAALVPLVSLLVVVVALALLVGALVDGRWRGAATALGVAVGAAAVAFVLHLPWSFELLGSDGRWWALGGVAPLSEDRVAVTELLRFGSGTAGTSHLQWATLAVAALPLALARGHRFDWAVRLWCVALACWGLALAAGSGWLVPLPPTSLLLVPGAASLALAAGIGVAALEERLAGTDRKLRRLATVAAAALVGLAALPVVTGAVDGRWGTPDADFAGTLSFTGAPDVRAGGDFRVLWIGHPANLPVGSRDLGDGLAFGIADSGAPDILQRWSPPGGAVDLAGEAVALAADGRTERLGRLLAPLGVRYLVMPSSAVPEREEATVRPPPPGLLRSAARQLDLRAIQVDSALALYENTAFAPVRTMPDDDAAERLASDELFPTAVGLDLSGAPGVLPEAGHLHHEGQLAPGTLYVSEVHSDRWTLEVSGNDVEGAEALGWATSFAVTEGGDATLRYRTSPVHGLVTGVQVALWLGALVWLVRRRRPVPA